LLFHRKFDEKSIKLKWRIWWKEISSLMQRLRWLPIARFQRLKTPIPSKYAMGNCGHLLAVKNYHAKGVSVVLKHRVGNTLVH